MSFGKTVIPRGNEKESLGKIWGGGANKVYFGKCGNGKDRHLGDHTQYPKYQNFSQSVKALWAEPLVNNHLP